MRPSPSDLGDLEDRLRQALHERAADTSVAIPDPFVPGPARIGRRRLRRGVPAVGIVLAAAAVLAIAVIVTRDPSETITASQDLPEGFPRLVLDLPNVRVEHVDESVNAPPADDEVATFHVQAFRTAEGFDGPMLWIKTVPPADELPENVEHGFGEDGPESDEVGVQGSPAYLSERGGVVWLGWPHDDGGGVAISAFGLTSEDVVAVANALRPRSDAAGWETGDLPAGLAPVANGPWQWKGGHDSEISFVDGEGRTFQLWITSRDALGFEDLVFDRVNGAVAVEGITVMGRRGILSSYSEVDPTVIWRPNDTSVAELRGQVTIEEMRQVVRALRLVDEETWMDALPENALTPAEQAAEAARLQSDIPLPSGVSWDGFRVGEFAQDKFAFNFGLASYAACAWQQEWLAAVEAHNEQRVQEAVDVMAGVPSWTAMVEIDPDGDVPEELSGIASVMRDGEVDAVRLNVENTCV